ncbi:MAG: MarR family transcriptional regulator [Chloroflexi bacterium]|nr:MarR family transcriptional regulator [Chloroflexota bacterium]
MPAEEAPPDIDDLIERVCRQDQRFYYLVRSGPDPWLQIDLTMPQLKTLLVVHGLRPAAMGRVASLLSVGLSTATGLVDRLVEHGLVRRAEDSRDRRVVRVTTTDAGEELIARFATAGTDRLRLLLRRLDPGELRLVARALDLLYGAAQAEFEHQHGAKTPDAMDQPRVVSVGGRAEEGAE